MAPYIAGSLLLPDSLGSCNANCGFRIASASQIDYSYISWSLCHCVIRSYCIEEQAVNWSAGLLPADVLIIW
jgi:hypothetical protein